MNPSLEAQMMNTQRVAIVTGGSRGMGRNTALHLAQAGVDVLFTYNSSAAEADDLVEEIKKTGRKAAALQLDVGVSSTFEAFAARVRESLKYFRSERFDYLVNNAGISYHNAFELTPEEELDRVYRVNFKGVFLLTQKLLPLINDGGRIINLSSGLSRMTIPGSAAYGAMKGAIDVFTLYAAKELGPRRITVNAVAPGSIQTDFDASLLRSNPDMYQQVANMTALGRAGVADDIGPMIASLLADDNRWVNAQRIEVSGGMGI
jgi:NAD(P)-dependent dehydrogenase (short-subunit alcohol dehydrogenase family)